MKEHINKACQMAYWELRRISSIRQYLTEDAAKTLAVSLVLSRLDYGNCFLAGVFYINSQKSLSLPDKNTLNHSSNHYIGYQSLTV